jgi:hypothetical protein
VTHSYTISQVSGSAIPDCDLGSACDCGREYGPALRETLVDLGMDYSMHRRELDRAFRRQARAAIKRSMRGLEMAKSFSVLRDRIPVARANRNAVISAALSVDAYLKGVEHLRGCGVLYQNGSPCTCSLPTLHAAIDQYTQPKRD